MHPSMPFQFVATRAGFEFDAQALLGHAWSVAQRATIATLQAFHADIEGWGVDAVGVAWEAYSSDLHGRRLVPDVPLHTSAAPGA
jgi:hypothetical protein